MVIEPAGVFAYIDGCTDEPLNGSTVNSYDALFIKLRLSNASVEWQVRVGGNSIDFGGNLYINAYDVHAMLKGVQLFNAQNVVAFSFIY